MCFSSEIFLYFFVDDEINIFDIKLLQLNACTPYMYMRVITETVILLKFGDIRSDNETHVIIVNNIMAH